MIIKLWQAGSKPQPTQLSKTYKFNLKVDPSLCNLNLVYLG